MRRTNALPIAVQTGPERGKLLSLLALTAVFAFAIPAPCLQAAKPEFYDPAISFYEIPPSAVFPEAIAPESLYLACADDVIRLREFFGREGHEFNPGILRLDATRACHIWYEPTLHGFRAAPDDWPVVELFLDVHTLSFLSFREGVVGDVLDISRQILPRLSRIPLVTLGVTKSQSKAWMREAAIYHYPSMGGRIRLRNNSGLDSTSPWVQDYLKGGMAEGERKVLVTRILFEGEGEAGATFRPLLESFTESRFLRSRLSWEGGDLQFVQHPLDPGKLVLFYGDAAKKYWAEQLTDAEYAYVLKLEFGADQLVEMSGLAPHIDYSLALLPAERIALLSYPLRRDFGIARAAWRMLQETFSHVEAPELDRIKSIMNRGEAAFHSEGESLEKLMLRLVEKDLPWTQVENLLLLKEAIENYTEIYCPVDINHCLEFNDDKSPMRRERALFGEWMNSSVLDWGNQRLPQILLSIMASQLGAYAEPPPAKLKQKAKELEQLGFKVIRIPQIGGGGELGVGWAGIGYANALYLQNTLFVPTFGLGAEEVEILEKLQEKLPDSVHLVPVFAQHMQIFNGGLHCVTGLLRVPPGELPAVQPQPEVPFNLVED